MAGQYEPLDTATKVITPENIAFEYRLAGPFLRLAAFVLDRLIIYSLIILLGIGLSIAAGGALAGAVMLITWFISEWFYGGLFETYWNGKTPGKAAVGIRVITVDGRPISGMQAIMRNIMRFADLMPMAPLGVFFGSAELPIPVPLFLVGLFSMMFTRNYRRLGDLLCDTMVVLEQREWTPDVIHVETHDVVALAGQFPDSFRASRTLTRAVARYVERRRVFSPARRIEISRRLRDAFVAHYQLLPQTDPDLLMRALYYRIFIADRDRDESFLDRRRISIPIPQQALPQSVPS